MSFSIDDGAVNRFPYIIQVDDGTVWRTLTEIWVDDGTVWRLVYPNVTLRSEAVSVEQSRPIGFIAYAQLSLLNTGKMILATSLTSDSTQDWVVPNSAAADYEVRATMISGDQPIGTFGTWLAMTGNATWTHEAEDFEYFEGTFQIDIRRASDGVIVGGFEAHLLAQVEL